MIDAEEIKGYISFTFAPDDVINLRYKLRNGKAVNKAFRTNAVDAIASEIEKAEKTGVKDATREPVAYWVNCQHIRPEFLAAGRDSITDLDVDEYVMLPLDFDADKPKDVGVNSNSTEEEKQGAFNRMSIFRDAVRKAGWPEPIIVDSGNGGQLRYLTKLPVNQKELVQGLMKAVADNFGGDPSLFNPSRVLKLPGTMTRKGAANTADRPHRMSKVVSYPPGKWECVTTEMIVALVKMYPPKEETKPAKTPTTKSTDMAGAVRAWLHEWKVPILAVRTNGGTTLIDIPDSYCSNAKEHSGNANTGTSTSIIINDKIGYKCQHGHCTGIGWLEFRAHHDPAYKRNKSAPAVVRDTPAADWVARNYVANMCYVVNSKNEGEFWVYNGKFLEVDNKRASRKFMEDVAKDLCAAYEYQADTVEPKTEPVLYPDGNPIVDTATGETKTKQTQAYKDALARCDIAEKYLDAHNQRDLYDLLKNRAAAVYKEFNKNRNLLNVKNGIIDLTLPLNQDGSRQLLPHDPKYAITMMAPVEYIHGVPCPRFMEHVRRAFKTAEEERYARYIFGRAFRRVIRKDCSQVYFFGIKDTGKSTVALCVAGMLGTDIKTGYAITRNSSFNSEKNAAKATRDDVLQTKDKILIVVDEVRDEKQDAETMKAGSGGATRNERGVFRADVEMETTATTINTGNKPPRLPWEDDAAIARVVLCEFTEQIKNPDHSKPVFLDIVAEEGSGILNWCLEGDLDAELNDPPPLPERFKKTAEKQAAGRDVLGQYLTANYIITGDGGEKVENRTAWSTFDRGMEKYYTLTERTGRTYIPKRPSILETLKKYKVEITNDKTRVRGEPKPIRGVLLGIRPKTDAETEDEDVAAWMKDFDDTVKTVGEQIVNELLKADSKSAKDAILSSRLGIPKRVITAVTEHMISKNVLERDAVGDVAMKNRGSGVRR